MEGVRIVLPDAGNSNRRAAFAALIATLVTGMVYSVSTGASASITTTVSSANSATTTSALKGSASLIPKKGAPTTDHVSSKSVSVVTPVGPLSRFTTASIREMDAVLRSAKRKGPVPTTTQLARYTLAIRASESGGRYTIKPARGSTISGAYQASATTWDNYRGYRYAYTAPKSVQDAWMFRRLVSLWQTYNGDWERVTAHHFLPSYADENKALWRKPLPLRFRANNPPTVSEYVRRVFTHLS